MALFCLFSCFFYLIWAMSIIHHPMIGPGIPRFGEVRDAYEEVKKILGIQGAWNQQVISWEVRLETAT